MTGRIIPLVATACVALSLAACGAKGPSVQSAGTLPQEGGYAFVEGAAPPPQVAAALTETLAQKGLKLSDAPRYLVQAEYSRPPAKTGTLPDDQGAPKWLRAPTRRGGQVSHVTISVTEIATGAEVYRVAAWQRLRPKTDDAALLVQTAFNPPPAQ